MKSQETRAKIAKAMRGNKNAVKTTPKNTTHLRVTVNSEAYAAFLREAEKRGVKLRQLLEELAAGL